eukprot:GHVP01060751.1.p1 GENE.GHVP01060751.1~~GHVP01060751.1.p1  ORF type:complete len:449 (-),score=140.90 GHVP01060751.1:121-1467(-)
MKSEEASLNISDLVAFADLDSKNGLERKVEVLDKEKTRLPRKDDDKNALYMMIKTSVSRWKNPKHTKKTKKLLFPLPEEQIEETDQNPVLLTDFEEKYEKKLTEAKIKNRKDILDQEEKILSKYTEQEKERRIKEQRKRKEILFHEERENQRKNRIKSKQYRKMLKRKSIREAIISGETESVDQKETTRIESRMNAKRKKKTKFRDSKERLEAHIEKEEKGKKSYISKEPEKIENKKEYEITIQEENFMFPGTNNNLNEASLNNSFDILEKHENTDIFKKSNTKTLKGLRVNSKEANEDDPNNKIVSEAFKDEDYKEYGSDYEDFQEEKKVIEDKELESKKEKDFTGWNKWAGPGIVLHKKNPQQKKKPKGNPLVIINEEVVPDLYKTTRKPKTFKTKDEYNESIRKGVGREWNSEKDFDDLIRNDEIIVKAGWNIKSPRNPDGFTNQ